MRGIGNRIRPTTRLADQRPSQRTTTRARFAVSTAEVSKNLPPRNEPAWRCCNGGPATRIRLGSTNLFCCRSAGPCPIERLGRKNGSAFWNELSISPVIDEQGDVTHHSGVQKDITQQVDYEAELNTLLERVDRESRTDSLTGLLNRRGPEAVATPVWANAVRRGSWLSFFFIDIDHFKRINDRHSHPTGDACLKETARRLNSQEPRCSCLIMQILAAADASLHSSPISCCGPRYPRPDGAYSLQPVRRSVDYAFTAFHCVHPAIAASRRPRLSRATLACRAAPSLGSCR